MSTIHQSSGGEGTPTKTVSASEAKNKLGSMMGWVLNNQGEIIIERRGEPAVIIMSVEEYEKMKRLKEQARRTELLARLEQVRKRVVSASLRVVTNGKYLTSKCLSGTP